MRLLIPGGAGYIGSHMVRFAQEAGHEVVVLDNFSTGHRWAVSGSEVLEVDLLDQERLLQSLEGRDFDGVIHFAAKSLVGESVSRPQLYYRNNVVGTLNLVEAMRRIELNNLVFSSTAAIFGNPIEHKISEDHPKNPINPYGQSKLMVERVLEDICTANDFNATCLRYFNAAGAHPSGEIGEAHDPETHLIPNVFKAMTSREKKLAVFGNDYPTPDGTCVRDYIHVNDLAHAHLLSIEYMKNNNGFSVFNLGNGDGFSVLDIISGCQRIARSEILYSIKERREGDPARLVSDSKAAKRELLWRPQYTTIDSILASAWAWHKQ